MPADVSTLVSGFGQFLVGLVVRPASPLSISSLGAALLIAGGWLIARRAARNRSVEMRVLLRALIPKRMLFSPSARVDIGYTIFGTLLFGMTLGWAVLTYNVVTSTTVNVLVALGGQQSPSELPEWVVRTLTTLAVFMAFEFAYWLDHTLCHRIPALWAFHKVHHDAETLSPLTVFRVHPVDTIVYYNISALTIGLVYGSLSYAFGASAHHFTIGDANVLLVIVLHLIGHLHHSHMWIPFTGWAGRILMSPAHHQIHHSTNPAHFNRNMGHSLAIFDWLSGTLHVPSQKRERLAFGNTQPDGLDPHSVHGSVLRPFFDGAREIGRAMTAVGRYIGGLGKASGAHPTPPPAAAMVSGDGTSAR